MIRRAKSRTPVVKTLGPSNDDPPEVQVEMRAAELDAWYAVDQLSVSEADDWSGFEVDGWRAHCSDSDLVGSPSMSQAIRPDFDAGWLACELTMHDVRETRDATAWAWDISRPIAEQLAETTADDAAAGAPAVELLRELDDERASATIEGASGSDEPDGGP